MTAASLHRLEGLEPDNLLVFLALLGLLRALESDDRERAKDGKLRPRAAWDSDTPPLRVRLSLARAITTEEVTASAARGLEALTAVYEFDGRKDLNHSRKECRALLEQEETAAHLDARERIDLLAALMSDGALKDDRKEPIDPTPLCLLFGQGHQHFLDRLASVPRELVPPSRGGGKTATVVSVSKCLGEALFQAWHRAGTQHGANRLASIGLAALTLVPKMRGGRVRPSIVGGASGADGFSFAWPIWSEPATFAAIRALLAHRDLRKPGALAHLGVDQVMVARRISVGKFMSFSRTRPLLRRE